MRPRSDWLAVLVGIAAAAVVLAAVLAVAVWGNNYDHTHGGTCSDRGGHLVLVGGKVPVCTDTTDSP